MFDIVRSTKSTAIATSGTLTFSYPEGKNAGSYAAYGHSATVRALMVDLYKDEGDFSLSFGSSEITLTYNGSTTIPAGSEVVLQLNARGADDGQAPHDLVHVNRSSFAPVVRVDLGAPILADSDGICKSQSVSSGVEATIDGDRASNGVGVLDVPRNVVAAWTNAAVVTVTGTDEYGNTVIESSASGTGLTGKKAFKEVTSVVFSANVTGATVGFGDVLGLPFYIEKADQVLQELQDGVKLAQPAAMVALPFEIEQTELLAATAEQIVSPVAGRISRLRGICQTAIDTGGAVTVKVGSTDVDGLSITLVNSDAAGTVYSDTPTAGHASAVVAKGSQIQIVPGSAIDTAGALNGVVEIQTSDLDGTMVVGDQTTPSATTGDVRGTYDPAVACDGAKAFALLIAASDPTYKGVDQYDG